MDLRQTITDIGKTIPGQFEAQKDGSARMEAVIAERKAFLSKKKLTYICRFKVDDPAKEVRFFEMLKESGFGVSSGVGDNEMSTGFGFKKETYNTFGKERSGSIEEQSKLFGKDYSYRFDFGAFRRAVRKAAEGAGYRFEVKLMEKSDLNTAADKAERGTHRLRMSRFLFAESANYCSAPLVSYFTMTPSFPPLYSFLLPVRIEAGQGDPFPLYLPVDLWQN